jgi:hypothetical protein
MASQTVFAVLGVVVLLSLGCGADAKPEPADADATVLALGAADAVTVTVSVTGPGIVSPIIVALAKSGSQWGGVIGAIPAGIDRTFTLSARDAVGTEIYAGQATGITITPGHTATVVINAQQVATVPPKHNAAPVLDALVVSAITVAPGDVVSLAVTAHDPNPGDTLSYEWSANDGTFSAPAAPATTWTAPATAGTAHLRIRVRDQKNAQASMDFDIAVVAGHGKGKAAVTVTLNTWPVISDVTATPTRIDAGEATLLDVVASDSDGDALTYAWSKDCDGTLSADNVKSPTFTLTTVPASKACTLGVTVSDGKGGSNLGSITISAGPPPAIDLPPEVLTTYQSAETAASEDTVVLRVTAADPNGSPVSFVWTATAGTLGTPTTVGGTSEIEWTAPAAFLDDAEIQAAVTDGTWQTTVQAFVVHPKPLAWQSVTIPGMPASSYVTGVWASGRKNVYAASFVATDIPAGQVFHFDGASWTSVLSLPGEQTQRVFGTSVNDVFLVTYACPAGTAAGCGPDVGGRVYRSTNGGATWTRQTLPAEVGTNNLGTISGTPNNVHVSVATNIIRFDGTTWSTLAAGTSPYALTIVSADEGYFVSCWGYGVWNGSTWAFHNQGWDFCDANAIWAMRSGGDPLTMYVAGNQNWSNGVHVWRFNEATQSFGSKSGYVFADGNPGSANGIWGSGPNDVYVSGGRSGVPSNTAGSLFHYDGTSWSQVTAAGTFAAPLAIWGSSATNIWMGLADGTLLTLTH